MIDIILYQPIHKYRKYWQIMCLPKTLPHPSTWPLQIRIRRVSMDSGTSRCLEYENWESFKNSRIGPRISSCQIFAEKSVGSKQKVMVLLGMKVRVHPCSWWVNGKDLPAGNGRITLSESCRFSRDRRLRAIRQVIHRAKNSI